MSIGIVYGKLNQFDLPLQHLERSLQMKIFSLPPDHPNIGDAYGNMAAIYERQDNLFKALSFYEKALAIFAKSLPPTHSKNTSTERYIQHLKQILY
jgi:tetratricopeptide (TPR) repeat protein